MVELAMGFGVGYLIKKLMFHCTSRANTVLGVSLRVLDQRRPRCSTARPEPTLCRIQHCAC